ncbi:MAG: hypothetical protein MT332_02040 [Candidatus Nitrosopumilus limneticus]|nr:hypothetical protein [Candidatus Nitrosopumilus limneticus]MDC4211731.1 hypothetical protein [Candidatus Nitrosopumilus limneticus]MDC4214561.1 hypothetical protein [Candidatus Nitrosopumilus limneticus]MDC4216467.1 hypothetical protein [Candidatus Nitrosopumilus limneticus]MDC4217658.1 hypothetical protein [Candidatus Nitrosopumilus limneticus]
MFSSKPTLKEGTHIFSIKKNGEFNDFIFAVVSGVDGKKVGVNGVIVNPIGLKNKIAQGKTGQRSQEILNHPTPDNVVLALVYRVEFENFADVLDLDVDKCDIIPPKIYAVLDGWIRESLPEFINTVLSLAPGNERDQAKRILKNRMDTLTDPNLRRTLYSVCRSLKILN